MAHGISRRTFLGTSAAGALAVPSVANSAAMATSIAPIVLEQSKRLDELDTPALLIDLDKMESNLKKMADHARAKNIGLRPHTKTHKCPIIAKMQLELGAVGVCCAKVSEAEVMLDAGVDKILITSPVVTPEKIDRVIALAAKSPHIQMVVDNAKTVKDFDKAARARDVPLRVLIDLDVGTRRTGVALGEPAVKLLKVIGKSKSLRFDGIQAYAGHLMHVTGYKTRKIMSETALAKALETKGMMERAGFEVGTVTGSGTGTFDIDSDVAGMTDMQVGSYLFMDVQYREVGDRDSDVFDYFEPSLFVLVTAISQPVPERLITVDAGYKAFASDSVTPEFRDEPGLVYRWGGDEHGIVQLKDPSRPVKLGDKFSMIVSHCDPTVNLYDYYHPYRGDTVRELWPIAARGKSQ